MVMHLYGMEVPLLMFTTPCGFPSFSIRVTQKTVNPADRYRAGFGGQGAGGAPLGAVPVWPRDLPEGPLQNQQFAGAFPTNSAS